MKQYLVPQLKNYGKFYIAIRVAIYRFNPDWSGKFVAESVTNGWVPLVVQQKNDPSLTENVVEDENCTIKTLDEPDLIQGHLSPRNSRRLLRSRHKLPSY